MIKYQDSILLEQQPVFTKLHLQMPLTQSLHLPSDACFLYIDEGEGHLLFKPSNITATTGTVILSTCGLTVSGLIAQQPEGTIETTIVHFNQNLLDKLFDTDKPMLWQELQNPLKQFIVQEAADNLIQFYFNSIHELFKNKAALTDVIIRLKLKEIILLLLQTNNSESIREIIKSLFSKKVFSFKELVDAHIFSSASIENLAGLTNCSLSTFKRKFKATYHTSPGKFISENRLEKVAELLRISDDTVSQIGYSLGFESPEHLSRAFKKKFGQTPSTYRLNFKINL